MTELSWPERITTMVLVKQALREEDRNHVWPFHLPRVAASEHQLAALEETLGVRLAPDYRAFLSHADGWPAFYQAVDLLGTAELSGRDDRSRGAKLLKNVDDAVLARSGVSRGELLPIAASSEDMDLFVTVVAPSDHYGIVLWLAGDEIDRFPSFTEYFMAMIDYNRAEVEYFRNARPS